ncbi:alpha/beta hydrolase family protein [Arthrobacter monumenti]
MAVDVSATANLPDGSAISDAAAGLAKWGDGLADTFEAARGQWNQLTGLYQAPEQEIVLSALDRAEQIATAVRDTTATAAKALQVFATEVSSIQAAHTQLAADAAALQAEADDDGGLGLRPAQEDLRFNVAERELQDRADRLAERYRTIQDDCSRTLGAFERSSTDVPLHYSNEVDGGGEAFEVAGGTALFHRLQTGAGTDPAAGFDKYLAFLAGLSASQLDRFVASNPAAALTTPLRAAGHDPIANRTWWNDLNQDARERLSQQLPSLVGNLEGIDYDTRSAANATALALAVSHPFTTKKQRNAHKSIERSIQSSDKGRGQRSLISFDASDPPLAAVAIGDVDTANYVTFNVPGMGSHTGDMTGWTEASQNIYDEQTRIAPGLDQAVVAWVGYEPPEMFAWGKYDVFAMEHAETGAKRLSAALDGFHTARTANGDMPFTSVTAHSYGTTTAANALARTSFQLDTAVFYGSAGIDPDLVPKAKDMHVTTNPDGDPEVYATQAAGETIAPLGIAGSHLLSDDNRISPTDGHFGAKVFSSEGANGLAPTTGHSVIGEGENLVFWHTDEGGGYLDDNTQSLFSIGRIITGQAEEVKTTEADVTHRINEEILESGLRYVD